MINTKDFRIGNLVEILGEVKEITGVIRYGIYFEGGYCPNKEDWIKPIPITEDWLVKFGFEEALNGWWCSDEIFSYKDGCFGFGVDRFTEIKYIHQLQNIYFANTGKELPFKS